MTRVLHELKVWREPMEAIMEGRKRHEVRKEDRGVPFKEGDGLILREWDHERQEYTGTEAHFDIGYLSRGPAWGIPEGMVVFTLIDVSWT